MIPAIEQHKDQLAQLCESYRVVRLEVFGSAAEQDHNDAANDVDLLVEFSPDADLGPWLSHYFEFCGDIERLIGKPVDVIMRKALQNPFFVREVNRTRRLLYAA